MSGGIGHCHPTYNRRLAAQLEKVSIGSFTSEVRVELFERIAKFTPSPELHRLQLYSGGAEAVESALRLAKSYTGKYEFISFAGGFHGKTLGVLSLMGSDFKHGMGPFAPGSHIVPFANPLRAPHGVSGPQLVMDTIELARKQLKANHSGKIAAFLIEPMQGTAGNIVPPKEFLPAVRDLAREMGALFIADEMITGFGRTGRRWGVEHSGVIPDIITLGKQFGGGFPVSGVLTTDDISSSKPWSNPSGSSSSYGGNPLAAAAVAASLQIIDEEGLVENSRQMGEIFLSGLQRMALKYSFIAEARGAGLFLGVELVRDRATLEPMSKAACAKLFNAFLQRGLLTMAYAPAFRIQPAMTIDEATVQTSLAIIDSVFAEVEALGYWRE